MRAVPTYPRWRPLCSSDKPLLDRWCSAYAPYAEATTATLLIWNDPGACGVAELDENLLLRHRSCGDAPVVTVVGTRRPSLVCRQLIDDGAELHYVPDFTVCAEPVATWSVSSVRPVADRDNDDYVFDLTRLAALSGNALKGKRKRRNGFERSTRPLLRRLDPASTVDFEAILSCAEGWAAEHPDAAAVFAELRGLRLLLDLARQGAMDGLVVFGLFADERLVGFSIIEDHGTDTVSGVSFKALRSKPGAAEYLRSASAIELAADGYRWLNAQQDLGHLGLRQMKTEYRPVRMLRKWRVVPLERS